MDDGKATIRRPSGSEKAMSASFDDQNYYFNTINTNRCKTLNQMQLFTLKATFCLLSCLFHILVYPSIDYIALVELFVIDH